MSTWRLIVRALHDIGGSGTNVQIRKRMGGVMALDSSGVSAELSRAARLGVVSRAGRCKNEVRWQITPLGLDWAEGRITMIRSRPGGRRWVATWLASLPRGLRIQPARERQTEGETV